MDIDRLLPDGPLTPATGKDGTLRHMSGTNRDPELRADATHLALRATRIQLWHDLVRKVDESDARIATAVEEKTRPLREENRRLRRALRDLRRVA